MLLLGSATKSQKVSLANDQGVRFGIILKVLSTSLIRQAFPWRFFVC